MGVPPTDHQFLCTIAGSDPTGGAGLQADLKTFAAHGAQGASVVTAVTVQDRDGVHGVVPIHPATVAGQLTSVFRTRRPDGIKTGMLWSTEIIEAVARGLRERFPTGREGVLVVDPVLVATAGGSLMDATSLPALRELLFPQATLLTPNLPEAAALLGVESIPEEGHVDAARELHTRCDTAVLLKGGHGAGDTAVDVLAWAGGVEELSLPRIEGASGHGTGCALASALTARIARGDTLRDAAWGAKQYIHRAIRAGLTQGDGWLLDHGVPAE